MGLLSLTLPTVGQPNSTEQSKVRTALAAIQTEFNGNIETTNFKSSVTPLLIATGIVLPYAGSTTAPTGYLLCDGSAVSRTTYADLFALIGETYGAGDDSTTFNVPDLGGKTIMGYDSGDTDFDLADTGGAKTVTLTTAQMPAHTHGPGGGGSAYAVLSGSTQVPNNGAAFGNYGSASTTASTGGGESHDNLAPYLTLAYIIKT